MNEWVCDDKWVAVINWLQDHIYNSSHTIERGCWQVEPTNQEREKEEKKERKKGRKKNNEVISNEGHFSPPNIPAIIIIIIILIYLGENYYGND